MFNYMNYTRDGFVEDFIANFGWQHDAKRGARLALAKQARLAHADNVLSATPVGAQVRLEGQCPSGPTHWGSEVWDGTPECRARVLRRVWSDPDMGDWLTRAQA